MLLMEVASKCDAPTTWPEAITYCVGFVALVAVAYVVGRWF